MHQYWYMMMTEVINMAMEAKAMLLKDLELQLSTKITSADMAAVLSALSDQLANYNLIHTGLVVDAQDDLLDAYVTAMQIQGRSDKTVIRYQYIIRRMMRSVGVPTRSVTVYHLRKYLAQEKDRGISDRTLEGNREVFSAYFNWLQREGLIDQNPTANLGAIKCAKKIKTIYSEVDIEKLKTSCKCVRDRAIVMFLLTTGCRISEMCNLNRDDVDLVNLECKVFGKGKKERTVYLSPVSGMLIKNYLSERTDESRALFAGKGTSRMHPGGVRAMLCRVAEDASVDHVHPHKFRRTLATNLIRHGMAIQEVAAVLGHDKLDTTMEYVVLNKNDIKNAYNKCA